MTLNELKKVVAELTDRAALNKIYKEDERTGARRLVTSRLRQLDLEREQRMNYDRASTFEAQYAGDIICGIDEVGRGPLAGPVVACAVILEEGHYYPGLTDSKQLSAKKRQSLEAQLLAAVSDYALGTATVEEIDAINIYEASKLAMRRAVESLTVKPSVLLIDAMTLGTGLVEEALIKGDSRSVSIGAASIIAKEYRDRLMMAYDVQYPGYDFKNNAGYGTKKHLEGIERLGITPIHRRTFEPIKSIILHQ
ncbi:ribonuclease HII [Macrococcus equipercicus]|uniref:Ribonuclease HII n=1 Tax=Macrococcus equipercicus TaxID=69967 RepID=A0A9Q9BUE7_9STAP|nr:ribonuclease HII [Macrococcus equipercicus]KAA1036951.1 ribonuclease HII [Macrococcus equipercicus]UTH14664.1 ribonuclease HII [Macrococcus equipercicus]